MKKPELKIQFLPVGFTHIPYIFVLWSSWWWLILESAYGFEWRIVLAQNIGSWVPYVKPCIAPLMPWAIKLPVYNHSKLKQQQQWTRGGEEDVLKSAPIWAARTCLRMSWNSWIVMKPMKKRGFNQQGFISSCNTIITQSFHNVINTGHLIKCLMKWRSNEQSWGGRESRHQHLFSCTHPAGRILLIIWSWS